MFNIGTEVCARLQYGSQALRLQSDTLIRVAGRSKRKVETWPTLTVHQIVAYNFRRAREETGWTQTQTSDYLERHLGYKLNQAGVSAIERTFDSERRRNIDVAEVVAFARCFDRPIAWFFLPPAGLGEHKVVPSQGSDSPESQPAAIQLVVQAIGTPSAWQALVDRLDELVRTDRGGAIQMIEFALAGRLDAFPDQINLRRSALQQVTLARLASPGDEAITKLAEALVELVKLTPLGYRKLRNTDPDEALRLLAEGDQLVAPFMAEAELKRATGQSSESGYDALRPIDPRTLLAPDDEE